MRRVRLQFITHFNERYTYLDSARIALEGGCRWVQLRMKDASDDEFCEVAAQVEPICRKYDAMFVIDDRVHLVGKVNADGVHLGRNDMPIAEARRILGRNCIIGGTANTVEDIERIYAEGGDYIGCGPFRFTTTKEKLSPVLGLEGYARLTARMSEKGIRIPIVAIGGIKFEDIDDIIATGVSGIALSGSILNAENPVEEMRRTVNRIYKE